MTFGGNKVNYFSLLHGSSNGCFSWFVKRKKSQHPPLKYGPARSPELIDSRIVRSPALFSSHASFSFYM